MPVHQVTVNADLGRRKISRHIYGHFAEHLGRCIYDGLWVGPDSAIPNTRGFRNDLVAALRKLNIPNLRWPGGCFADTYHWMDGIGPPEKRPHMINVHWGGTSENNHCGTHEFLDLCEQLDCQPYIAGNVGSGTVREMSDWLEYITLPAGSAMAELRKRNGREKPWALTYWGVGNENWGCGGNMRPQYYSDLYRQYATYCRHHTPGGKLYRIACGFWEDWNQVILEHCHRFIEGLSVHYYCFAQSWDVKGSATGFPLEHWYSTLKYAADIEGFILRTKGQMDRFDPEKRIGIIMDEWGSWYTVEPGTNPGFLYQQNTIRDALIAGLTLNVFNRHADRVHMANIAQTINVLQAMALTEGPRMLLTPTYHVFEMYKVHQDATLLPSEVDSAAYGEGKQAQPQVNASASRDAAGVMHVSLCNLHHSEAAEVVIEARGSPIQGVTGRVLTGPATDSHNTFDAPGAIVPGEFVGARVRGQSVAATLPPRSVTVLAVR